MAYNLQSLINILQQILNPEQTRWIVDENKPQLESLLQKAETLQQILEKSPLTKIGNLESQIRDAVYKAEDIIESHMVRQMRSNPQGVKFTFITPYLQRVIQHLDSATAKVVKLVKWKKMLTGSSSSSGASFSHDLTADVLQATQELESLKLVEGKKMPTGGPLSSSKKDLVGVDEDLMQLKDRLTNMERKLEIIPITGMGGIGKTTLARKLYEDPDIVSHFEYAHVWTTVSQEYNMQAILLSLLRCISGKECDQNNDELKDSLYKSLYGRRYMIVIDDVWSTKFWDEVRNYFPNNNNGSRILITTRESGVAKYVAGSSSTHHDVQLLSKFESWNLLRQIVFGEEDRPDHVLQEIGKEIASECGGLPLAINVIGGLLSKIERSKDAWEKIGKDVIAAIAESDEQCSSILSLSYNNLPNQLKPCFLYMGAFPEDYEIKGSRLVRMWVAEGFVRSNIGNKSLEEEAQDCLKALVERNLFMVRDYKYGKPQSYSMHDLLRDLCIKKSDDEKFLHVKNGAFCNPRRVSVDTPHGMEYVNASAESMSLTRSFIGIGRSRTYNEIPSGAFSALRLVRVLDIMDMELEDFPREIFELVNLRFLAFRCGSCIPTGISRLWHLQILIAYADEFADASEIWELPELRYFKGDLYLHDVEEMINSVKKKKLLKLQMISYVVLAGSVMMRDFLKSIPNIKKLAIEITDLKTSMEIDLSHLHKLEIIKYRWDYLPKVNFPCNIRKLFLENCVTNPGVLRTLCGLPKLEVLKIIYCKFEREKETCDGDEFEREEERCEEEWEETDGDDSEREEEETSCYEDRELAADGDEFSYDEEWVLSDGDEFPSLHFLSLQGLDIVRWIADETNFPRLRNLHLIMCSRLEEIPSGIGEIPTLQLIHLQRCSQSAEASARRIAEEQKSDYDNYDLKLSIN